MYTTVTGGQRCKGSLPRTIGSRMAHSSLVLPLVINKHSLKCSKVHIFCASGYGWTRAAFFFFFILFYWNRFTQQQRSQEGSYVHKRLIANINLGPFTKTKTLHNSYIYNYMHRRRKILKVGGAKDMIAHANISDYAHFRSNHAHFWTIDATATTRFSPQKNER